MSEVSHTQIFERLIKVEEKVDRIEKNTENVVNAFNAAQGAFTVLEMLGKLARPLLWIGGLFTAAVIAWQNFKSKEMLACFSKSTKVSSRLKTFKPPRSKPFRINPLPAPGAPAKIIALGLPCTSLSSCIKLIIKIIVYYKYERGWGAFVTISIV